MILWWSGWIFGVLFGWLAMPKIFETLIEKYGVNAHTIVERQRKERINARKKIRKSVSFKKRFADIKTLIQTAIEEQTNTVEIAYCASCQVDREMEEFLKNRHFLVNTYSDHMRISW